MNDQRLQFFAGKFQNSKTTLFCLGAGFCYLLAGQPQKAFAALTDENREPQRKTQNIGKLVADLNARCEKTSLLDRLKNRPEKSDFLEQSSAAALLVGTDACPGLTIPAGTYTAGAPYTDSGTTVGANNTVNSIQSGCSNYTVTAGPDVIYRLTLPAVASRPATTSITVTPSGGYDTAIYLLNSSGTACPAGTANAATNCVAGNDAGLTNAAETITDAELDALPAGTYYLFVDSFYSAGNAGSPNRHQGPYTLSLVNTIVPATAASSSVGGQIVSASGSGISRVTVTATDANGQVRLAVTNPFGYFNFDDLPSGETYIIRVSSKTHQFANPEQIISVTDNIGNLVFTAND